LLLTKPLTAILFLAAAHEQFKITRPKLTNGVVDALYNLAGIERPARSDRDSVTAEAVVIKILHSCGIDLMADANHKFVFLTRSDVAPPIAKAARHVTSTV
jgi:hypothetical protein